MSGNNVTVHLLAVKPGANANDVIANIQKPLIKAIPYGWVHVGQQSTQTRELADRLRQQPQGSESRLLISPKWNLFLVTEPGDLPSLKGQTDSHLSVNVRLPKEQYQHLQSRQGHAPRPSPKTPPLPGDWQAGGIPTTAIDRDAHQNPLRPGELRLDPKTASFLTSALPDSIANKTCALFNVFKYKDGNSKIHDDYMEGFKAKFGDAAGASVLFMGPVEGEVKDGGKAGYWQDANLVQYDTIWNYGFMLSTSIYQELNQQKMDGLEDTGILCVSEVELADS